MGRLIPAAVVLVCLGGVARGESKKGIWLRRVSLAASCATSFWDFQTTRTAIGYGGRESNRMFADGQGNPRWGRMIGIKIGQCALMGVSQELLDRYRGSGAANYAWTAANSAITGRFVAAVMHNRRVTQELKQTPAYLKNRADPADK
ncbi:MAG: hypothetical protein IT160_04895 [Bryobacterales bacterium]|nr:hypothetical protein [Bryobacterales bacterium]